jgi:hypothetical protein
LAFLLLELTRLSFHQIYNVLLCSTVL